MGEALTGVVWETSKTAHMSRDMGETFGTLPKLGRPLGLGKNGQGIKEFSCRQGQ